MIFFVFLFPFLLFTCLTLLVRPEFFYFLLRQHLQPSLCFLTFTFCHNRPLALTNHSPTPTCRSPQPSLPATTCKRRQKENRLAKCCAVNSKIALPFKFYYLTLQLVFFYFSFFLHTYIQREIFSNPFHCLLCFANAHI